MVAAALVEASSDGMIERALAASMRTVRVLVDVPRAMREIG